MSAETLNTAKLFEFVGERCGLPLVGVAPTARLLCKIDDEILAVARKLDYAVVIGHPLSRAVLETIADRPNLIYKHHYQQVNWRLDRTELDIALYLQMLGANALPIPASVIVDWQGQRGHLSHRDAAIEAGLGWRGRHGLVVTREFGAQIRFATILTDLPLIAGEPISGNCGTCRACIEACPAGAISDAGCDVAKCYEKLHGFSKISGIGQYICGVCIKACKGKG